MGLMILITIAIFPVIAVIAKENPLEKLLGPSYQRVLPEREAGPLKDSDGSWLCVAEYSASIKHKPGEVLGSESSKSGAKFVISNEGVKPYGKDYVVVGHCHWTKHSQIACGKLADSIAEEMGELRFFIDLDGVFTFSGATASFDGQTLLFANYMIKGKCSKL